MKTITEIRYSNFLDIIENEVSSIQEMADVMGRSHSQISQMKTRNKSIGDKIARLIEESFEKPNGWMDTDHSAKDGEYPRTPSEEDYVLIPQYAARGECGTVAVFN